MRRHVQVPRYRPHAGHRPDAVVADRPQTVAVSADDPDVLGLTSTAPRGRVDVVSGGVTLEAGAAAAHLMVAIRASERVNYEIHGFSTNPQASSTRARGEPWDRSESFSNRLV